VDGTGRSASKDFDSHAIKALLISRALLVKIKRDIERQIRGLLKNLGLITGRSKMNMPCAPRSWPRLGQNCISNSMGLI